MASPICSGSWGSMYLLPGPAASLKHPPLLVITGVPETSASSRGIPNPSKNEG